MEHIDGVPFRKLGNENNLSGVQAYNRVSEELSSLPDNTGLTKTLCDPIRFSSILVVDGKFVKVRGFKEKIPLVWALDYLTHDPVIGLLAATETTIVYRQIFQQLKLAGYWIKVVVADDRGTVNQALQGIFPEAQVQLCQNHYLENIRRQLKIRTDEKYQHFFNSLKKHVFTDAANQEEVVKGLRHVLDTHVKDSELLRSVVMDINARRQELFCYFNIPNCPKDTNLIELYNSHLQARLSSIKGFKSFQAAQIWLNAYLIRRRTKPLTDCKGKFQELNGHASLELTIKKQAQWPDSLKNLGINKVNFFEKSGKKN